MAIGPKLEKFVRRRIGILYNPLLSIFEKYLDFDSIKLRITLRRALQNLSPRIARPVFVQVGSNDGFSNDPFCEWVLASDCRGFFFEPVPSCYLKLVNNYEQRLQPDQIGRLKFINAAVSDKAIRLHFYSVSERAELELGSRVPHWWSQLGSFNREHISRHLDGILDPFIVETPVVTTTLSDFAKNEQLLSLDVLHIDAEGHDFEVLQSIDFDEYKPSIILIEHKHLTFEKKTAVLDRLQSNGYALRIFRSDVLGVLR